MSAFVDTNVLVRHLTGDPPEIAERATAYLAAEHELLVSDLIVAETIYVLESYDETPRDDRRRHPGTGDAAEALEVYDRLDFAEAYLVAAAETTGVGRIASCDRTIDRIASVERIEPSGS